MKKIVFKEVLPHVFSDRADMDSDIWKSDASFEKGICILLRLQAVWARARSAATCWAIVTTIRAPYSLATTMCADISQPTGAMCACATSACSFRSCASFLSLRLERTLR